MKKILRTLMFGLLLCTGALATSCSSDPDPVMDSIPYQRVLTPLNFEGEVVASVGTDILFRWEALEHADGYVLQVFEAVGEEALAPDYETATPAFEYEVTNEEIPFTATGLEVDKSYWARVKGVSETLADSHWAYLKESVATAAVRKSLEPFVKERTENTVTIGWKDAEDKEDLTSVRVEKVQPQEGDEPVLYTLTDEDIEAAEATLEGLVGCTNYKFTLLFGKSGQRGVATAWTRPSAEGFNTVDTPEAIYNALNGTIGEVKLLVEYREEPYDFSSYVSGETGVAINCNLTLMGKSNEEGKQPVISNFALSLGNDVTSLRFQDMSIDATGAGWVVDILGANLSALEFENCDVSGAIKGFVNSQNSAGKIQKLLVSNCHIHDINAGGLKGGDFFDLRAGEYGDIELTNTTFGFCARTFIRAEKTKVNSVNVKNCTFNAVTLTETSSNNNGIFYVKKAETLTAFNCTKCVFLNMNNAANAKQVEDKGKPWMTLAGKDANYYAPVCSGNIYYNVDDSFFDYKGTILFGTDVAFDMAAGLAGGGMVLPNDPCSNSEAGKLYLVDPTIAAQQAGDPRWWNAVEPVVIRETKLTPEVAPRTWNFLEKTIFQTETVEDKTIIDNIQIYGPAEITMGKGITFTAEGEMAGDKPAQGALAILVDGVGALEITTDDAGYNASLQVVSGADRYTVQADGKTHKVVLGDLTGENYVYILSAAGVNVKQVTWTDDLTPEVTVTTLKTPAVSFGETSSVFEGDSIDVVASWAAVENAATYAVTFMGQSWEQTELTYTLPAATVATMAIGSYEMTVQAKPVETSSKFVASEIGKATFTVKEVVTGGEVTLKWDFTDAGFDTYYTQIGKENNTAVDLTWDGLHIYSGGGSIKANEKDWGRYVQMGGAGSATKRTMTFKAPASGTLKVKASATNDTPVTDRFVTVNVNGVETSEVGGFAQSAPEEVVFDIVVDGETDVVIYPTGNGLCFWSVEYTYVAATTPEPLYWGKEELTAVWGAFGNHTNDINAASMDTATAVADLTFNADSWTYKGLEFCFGGGKFKFGENNNNAGEKVVRMQAGTGDVSKLKQVFVFEAPAAGKLTVEACSSGDAARAVGVTVDNTALTTQDAPDKTNNAALLTFDCATATAGSKIYIYSTNSSINFFSFKYEM